MAFIPVPNTVMAEVRLSLGGQLVENVLYFTRGDAVSEETMGVLGAILLGWWDAQMGPLTSNAVTLREVYLTDLTSATAPAITSTPTGIVTGDLGDPVLPNNVNLVVSFRTSGRGRSSRGRNYVLGATEPLLAGNVFTGTYAEDLIAAYSAIVGLVATEGWTWSVVSRFSGGLPRVTGISQPITAVVITDLVVDSQRRRLPGRGT